MADVEAHGHQHNPTTHQPKFISRFSTCTSTKMAQQGIHTHIVPKPAWSTILDAARWGIALVVLAFTATAAGIWGGGYAAFGFTLFTASATLLLFGYYYIALCRKPNLYNRWAFLGLEIFGVVFWAVSFSLLAGWTAAANNGWLWYDHYDGSTGDHSASDTRYGFWDAPFTPEDLGIVGRDLSKRADDGTWDAGIVCAGLAAGFGALEFAFFVVSLYVFSAALHRHRKAGNPAVHGASVPATAALGESAVSASSVKESGEAKKEVKTVAAKKDGVETEVLRKESGPVV